MIEALLMVLDFNFVPEAAASNISRSGGETDSTYVKYLEENGEREITCKFYIYL